MNNKKKNRPLVRTPEDLVGVWKHYDVILKSNVQLEDAWKFDEDVQEMKCLLSELTKQS